MKKIFFVSMFFILMLVLAGCAPAKPLTGEAFTQTTSESYYPVCSISHPGKPGGTYCINTTSYARCDSNDGTSLYPNYPYYNCGSYAMGDFICQQGGDNAFCVPPKISCEEELNKQVGYKLLKLSAPTYNSYKLTDKQGTGIAPTSPPAEYLNHCEMTVDYFSRLNPEKKYKMNVPTNDCANPPDIVTYSWNLKYKVNSIGNCSSVSYFCSQIQDATIVYSPAPLVAKKYASVGYKQEK
ncbi:MAG: hypothetical protein AABX05_00710, partial [Nanoarchaeota archaeon]